jgi:hypothetical protein
VSGGVGSLLERAVERLEAQRAGVSDRPDGHLYALGCPAGAGSSLHEARRSEPDVQQAPCRPEGAEVGDDLVESSVDELGDVQLRRPVPRLVVLALFGIRDAGDVQGGTSGAVTQHVAELRAALAATS